MICDQATIADICGVTPETIRQWQALGMPYVPRDAIGGGNQYDSATVLRWRIDYALRRSGMESQKDRLSRLQADRIELELAEMRGNLVPAAEIEPTWAGMVLAARAQLLALPARLAGQIGELTTYDARRALLQAEIDATLSRLSDYSSQRERADGEGRGAVGTAFADDAGAVGGAASLALGEEHCDAGPLQLRSDAIPAGAA